MESRIHEEAEFERIRLDEAAGAELSFHQDEFRQTTVSLSLTEGGVVTVREYPGWYWDRYLEWEYELLNGPRADAQESA